jgi:hypothetical protein
MGCRPISRAVDLPFDRLRKFELSGVEIAHIPPCRLAWQQADSAIERDQAETRRELLVVAGVDD